MLSSVLEILSTSEAKVGTGLLVADCKRLGFPKLRVLRLGNKLIAHACTSLASGDLWGVENQ